MGVSLGGPVGPACVSCPPTLLPTLNAEWQTLRREFHAPAIDIANKEVGELESLISAESYTEDDLVEMLQRVVFALVSSGDSLGPL